MMSLQIGLAVAGGLVLAGVVAHSAWSARKNKPKQPTPKLTPDQAPEPEHQPAAGSAAQGGALHERHEPSFDAAADQDSGLAVLSALTTMMVIEKKPGLDALIDVIAPVLLESHVSGEAALVAMPATRRVGSKPFAVEGSNAGTGEWEFPTVGQRYSAFQCGVQLANRMGALNQIEYSEFVMKAQAFADAIGGEPEFPEMLD